MKKIFLIPTIMSICVLPCASLSGCAQIKVQGIEIEGEENKEVTVGGTLQLICKFTPSDASDRRLTWTSSNAHVIIDSNGLARGNTAGDATITVKSHDGGFSDTCKIKVIQLPEKVIINNGTGKTAAKGQKFQLTCTVQPQQASQEVTWSSSNENVAKVDAQGNVECIDDGDAVITATAGDGICSDECNVHVNSTIVRPAAEYWLETQDILLNCRKYSVSTYPLAVYPVTHYFAFDCSKFDCLDVKSVYLSFTKDKKDYWMAETIDIAFSGGITLKNNEDFNFVGYHYEFTNSGISKIWQTGFLSIIVSFNDSAYYGIDTTLQINFEE